MKTNSRCRTDSTPSAADARCSAFWFGRLACVAVGLAALAPFLVSACGGSMGTGNDGDASSAEGDGGRSGDSGDSGDASGAEEAARDGAVACTHVGGGGSTSSGGGASCQAEENVVCGAETYTVRCACPEATCTCKISGGASSSGTVPYSGCADACGKALDAEFASCGFPR